jgi:hypothetical protein
MARVVILIYTGIDKGDWAWPILEVGYANNPANPSECKTICFHPPGSAPPAPLQHLQSVAASEEGVAQFLRRFFGTDEIIPGEPINPAFANDGKAVEARAIEIAKGFHVVDPWEANFTRYFHVVVEETCPEKYADARVPRAAFISSDSTALGPLFDLEVRPPDRDKWTWDQFMQVKRYRDDEPWITELGERFKYAAQGQRLKSTTASFEAADAKRYRPLVHRVELSSNNDMTFEVIFVEMDPGAPGRRERSPGP